MNWQEERDATLCEARCVVVKVGSAVLSTGSELNLPVLDNLVNQLAVLSRQGRRVVLVSSGAVAAGRTALKKLPGEPAAVGLSGKQAAAAVGQGRLMHLYDNAFAERGILAAQVLLTRDDLKNRTRFLNIRNTFSELLSWGVIPVVNENDTVSVNELKFSDNDNLASLLINPVEADLFVNLTTIGGVLDANPAGNPRRHDHAVHRRCPGPQSRYPVRRQDLRGHGRHVLQTAFRAPGGAARRAHRHPARLRTGCHPSPVRG